MPKLRTIPFETQIIERYRRRESSVEEALIEMYLAGLTPELYNVSSDQREEKNILSEYPEIGKRLSETLQTIYREGRSTPELKQKILLTRNGIQRSFPCSWHQEIME